MRDISCLWIGRLNIVKMSVLPKLIYRFIFISADFFIEINKLVLKFI